MIPGPNQNFHDVAAMKKCRFTKQITSTKCNYWGWNGSAYLLVIFRHRTQLGPLIWFLWINFAWTILQERKMHQRRIGPTENFFLVPKEISFVQCSSSSPSAQTVENTQTRLCAGCVRGQSLWLQAEGCSSSCWPYGGLSGKENPQVAPRARTASAVPGTGGVVWTPFGKHCTLQE